MEIKNCKTCGNKSIVGIDILGIHICTDCIDSIKDLEIGDETYEYYKSVIGKAWTKDNKAWLN